MQFFPSGERMMLPSLVGQLYFTAPTFKLSLFLESDKRSTSSLSQCSCTCFLYLWTQDCISTRDMFFFISYTRVGKSKHLRTNAMPKVFSTPWHRYTLLQLSGDNSSCVDRRNKEKVWQDPICKSWWLISWTVTIGTMCNKKKKKNTSMMIGELTGLDAYFCNFFPPNNNLAFPEYARNKI